MESIALIYSADRLPMSTEFCAAKKPPICRLGLTIPQSLLATADEVIE